MVSDVNSFAGQHSWTLMHINCTCVFTSNKVALTMPNTLLMFQFVVTLMHINCINIKQPIFPNSHLLFNCQSHLHFLCYLPLIVSFSLFSSLHNTFKINTLQQSGANSPSKLILHKSNAVFLTLLCTYVCSSPIRLFTQIDDDTWPSAALTHS